MSWWTLGPQFKHPKALFHVSHYAMFMSLFYAPIHPLNPFPDPPGERSFKGSLVWTQCGNAFTNTNDWLMSDGACHCPKCSDSNHFWHFSVCGSFLQAFWNCVSACDLYFSLACCSHVYTMFLEIWLWFRASMQVRESLRQSPRFSFFSFSMESGTKQNVKHLRCVKPTNRKRPQSGSNIFWYQLHTCEMSSMFHASLHVYCYTSFYTFQYMLFTCCTNINKHSNKNIEHPFRTFPLHQGTEAGYLIISSVTVSFTQ